MREKPRRGGYRPGVADAVRHQKLLDRLQARHEALETSEYAEFASQLAREAGGVMRKYSRSGSDRKTEWKSDNSPITVADKEISTLVIDRIKQRYPSHTIISEEEEEKGVRLDPKGFT